jgi:hypothetical protein
MIALAYSSPATVGHRITDAGVTLILPHGRELTDAEARKLAWGILADLSPDEVEKVPDVVTHREAARLALIGALRSGAASINELAAALGDLLQDGRAERIKISPHDIRFRMAAHRYIETERVA